MIDQLVEKASIVPEYNSHDTFVKKCLKNEQEVCIFAMLDGRKNNQKSINDFNDNMKIYNHLNSAQGYTDKKEIKIHYVNATCHVRYILIFYAQKEFTKHLVPNDKLPNFIVLWPKRGSYLRQDSSYLEGTSLSYYIKQALENRFNVFNYFDTDKLVFENDCSLIHEKYEEPEDLNLENSDPNSNKDSSVKSNQDSTGSSSTNKEKPRSDL